MFERILVPLDGSDAAETALPYAKELAAGLGSELIVYHVHRREDEDLKRMHEVYLENLADSVRKNLLNTKAVVKTQIEAGEPSESICRLVDKSKVDLIVMTAVSSAGMRVGKMLGSVSDQVCRTVPIPVMLTRPQNTRPRETHLLNRMLIPVDGSGLSKMALPVGEELAVRLKLSITVFQMANIVRFFDDGMGTTPYIDYAALNEEEKKRVTAQMQEVEASLADKGINATSIVTSGFDPAFEIMEVSTKIGADLVVMSTHGRTGLGRWVFGNVAEKVLRHGQTPLLLVHAAAG